MQGKIRTATALQKLREISGDSQEGLARMLGKSLWTYIRWERGDRTPDARSLIRLADHFGVEPRAVIADRFEATDAVVVPEAR